VGSRRREAGGGERVGKGIVELPVNVDGPELGLARLCLGGTWVALLLVLVASHTPGQPVVFPIWSPVALFFTLAAVLGTGWRWQLDEDAGRYRRVLWFWGLRLPLASYDRDFLVAATVEGHVEDNDHRRSSLLPAGPLPRERQRWTYRPVLVDRRGDVHDVQAGTDGSFEEASEAARVVSAALEVPVVRGKERHLVVIEGYGEDLEVLHEEYGGE
jgi:hypothetical protein